MEVPGFLIGGGAKQTEKMYVKIRKFGTVGGGVFQQRPRLDPSGDHFKILFLFDVNFLLLFEFAISLVSNQVYELVFLMQAGKRDSKHLE